MLLAIIEPEIGRVGGIPLPWDVRNKSMIETCRLDSENGSARVKGSRSSTFGGEPVVAVG
jgi:hypothetical protein